MVAITIICQPIITVITNKNRHKGVNLGNIFLSSDWKSVEWWFLGESSLLLITQSKIPAPTRLLQFRQPSGRYLRFSHCKSFTRSSVETYPMSSTNFEQYRIEVVFRLLRNVGLLPKYFLDILCVVILIK